jgi:hypothetical protein
VGIGILVTQAAGEERIRGPQIGLALSERLLGEWVSSCELLSFLEGKGRKLCLFIMLVVGLDQEITRCQMP